LILINFSAKKSKFFNNLQILHKFCYPSKSSYSSKILSFFNNLHIFQKSLNNMLQNFKIFIFFKYSPKSQKKNNLKIFQNLYILHTFFIFFKNLDNLHIFEKSSNIFSKDATFSDNLYLYILQIKKKISDFFSKIFMFFIFS
jgi:hypothetical protein